MNERTTPADRTGPSPFDVPPGQPYAGLARGSNWSRCVAHASTRWYSRGMKRMGLPAPVGNWITVEEAAKKLGMSTAGVRQLVRRKQLARHKFGKISAFRDVDVEKIAKKPAATGRPRKGFAPG